MPDGRRPEPGGWNRIHFAVEDSASDVQRLKGTDVNFRNEIMTGPGSQQIRRKDAFANQSSSSSHRHHASHDSGGTVLTTKQGPPSRSPIVPLLAEAVGKRSEVATSGAVRSRR
jgi:hypothetical protein